MGIVKATVLIVGIESVVRLDRRFTHAMQKTATVMVL
jgi:hypothetical protein